MGNETANRTPVMVPLRAILGNVAKIVIRAAIGLAGLVVTSFFSIDPLADSRPRSTPVSAFSDRFVFELPSPTAEGADLGAARRDLAAALAAVTSPTEAGQKADRLDERTAGRCGTSPRGAGGCPSGGEGGAIHRPARYVTVERRTSQAMSELVRYQLTDVASY